MAAAGFILLAWFVFGVIALTRANPDTLADVVRELLGGFWQWLARRGE